MNYKKTLRSKTMLIVATASILSAAIIIHLNIAPTSANVTPADTPSGSSIDQRIEQRKQERSVSLDDRQIKRLESRCTAAQSKTRGILSEKQKVFDNREKTYKRINAKIFLAIGGLQLAQKDTFEFEKIRIEYEKRTTTFNQAGNNYKQTLEDIISMNCRADVVGFQALVDTARLYEESIKDQSRSINNYVVNDIRNALNDFTKELQSKPAEEE
jgi:hypothetical protein